MADTTFSSLDEALSGAGFTDTLPATPPAPPVVVAPSSDLPIPATSPTATPPEPVVVPPVAATPPPVVPPVVATPPPSAALPPATPPATPPADLFASVTLPPYAKPATSAAFQQVKDLAAAEIKKRDEELTKLRAQATAPISADKLPKEVADELAELRKFRETTALENDPIFEQKYSAPLAEIDAAIYEKFSALGVPPKSIEDIKAMGGPAALDLDDMYVKLDAAGKDTTGLKRFVEAKLVRREELLDEKSKAVKAAKENYGKFAEDRKQREAKAEETKLTEVNSVLTNILQIDPNFAVEELPVGATEDQKKANLAHKEFITGLKTRMDSLSKEMTPSNFAQTVASWGIAHIFKARLDAEMGVTKALQADLATTKARLETILKAGAAPKPGGQTVPRSKGTPKQADQFGSVDEAFAAAEAAQKAQQD